MVNTRDFLTLLLARVKVTSSKDIKKAVPKEQPLQKKRPYVTRQVPAHRPKSPTYRPASNM
jgi:hypothetical protein